MADTVLNTTVFDGSKKLITHYNVVSDGTGGTTKIVDVSALNSNNGKTCKTVRLNKVRFNVSVTAPADAIRMQWDADTDGFVDGITAATNSTGFKGFFP